MPLIPRDYQHECIEAHYQYFSDSDGNPLFEVPTGGGKSLIMAEFVKRAVTEYEARVLMLTHVQELIDQNAKELLGQWGGGSSCPLGVYHAGLGRRESHEQIVYAGIQSSVIPIPKSQRIEGGPTMQVAKPMQQPFDIVLVDEAHLIPHSGQGRYKVYFEELLKSNPDMRVCGYTATPYRLNGGWLHRGSGAMFDDIAYRVSVERLIDDGHLVSLRSKRAGNQIDTSGMRKRAGEWVAADVEREAMLHVAEAMDEALQYISQEGRQHRLYFASGVDHALAMKDILAGHGIDARCVFGNTPQAKRRALVEAFRDGSLRDLINVGCLTTGFNAPRLDCMVVMRPTESTSLYVQMMGRGMRPFPGKEDCLVLDYGGNVRRHGPINRIDVRDKGDKVEAEAAPTKVCPQCNEEVFISIKVCPGCGYEFPAVKREHDTRAGDLDPVQRAVKLDEPLQVDTVIYSCHTKPGKPPSMRVTYSVGGKIRADEWVTIEHGGWLSRKAASWWLSSGGSAPAPRTVEEALKRTSELRSPSHVHVAKDGQYWRVKARVTFAGAPSPRVETVNPGQGLLFG